MTDIEVACDPQAECVCCSSRDDVWTAVVRPHDQKGEYVVASLCRRCRGKLYGELAPSL